MRNADSNDPMGEVRLGIASEGAPAVSTAVESPRTTPLTAPTPAAARRCNPQRLNHPSLFGLCTESLDLGYYLQNAYRVKQNLPWEGLTAGTCLR